MQSSVPVVEVDSELADLIPQYLSNRWADLNFARRLVENGDFYLLAGMAHRIRGSAASYGFVRLGEIAKAIETAADLQDREGVIIQLASYDAYLRAVRIEYT